MKKRLNYTGRKKLAHKGQSPEVKVALRKSGNAPYDFVVSINLRNREQYEEGSRFVMDATYGAYRERYEIGSIATVENEYRNYLNHIPPEAAVFRFKIVSDEGLLLARSARIKPEPIGEGGDQQPTEGFIGVQSVEMDDIWRLRLQGNTRPVLEVNKSLNIKSRLNDDPAFKAGVFPAVFRELLLRYLIAGDGEDQWRATVIGFAHTLVSDDYPEVPVEHGEGYELGASEQNNWIDAAVSRYCRNYGFLNAFSDEDL